MVRGLGARTLAVPAAWAGGGDGLVQKAIEIFIHEENYDDWVLSLRFQSGVLKNYNSTIRLNFDRMLR